MGKKFVDVVFVEDWDAEVKRVHGAPAWGEWDEIARYLARWDFGEETDRAHTTDTDPAGSLDYHNFHTIGGVQYRLTYNPGLRYVALTRRPVGQRLWS